MGVGSREDANGSQPRHTLLSLNYFFFFIIIVFVFVFFFYYEPEAHTEKARRFFITIVRSLTRSTVYLFLFLWMVL